MSASKLPAVRLPVALPGNEDGVSPSPIVVELSASNKFGFAWPAETPGPLPHIPHPERATVSLSSSEGESEMSGAEENSILQSQTDQSENEPTPINRPSAGSHRVTSSEELEKDPVIPRFSRAVSMPLPSRLGGLQNPRRPSQLNGTPTSPISENPPEHNEFQELSLELADSVQMMVQTLLQISPSQVLDPVKEQFSACTLSVPTPCMSAVFNSLKNLNYISANMAAFCAESAPVPESGVTDLSVVPLTTPGPPSTIPDDFDIGELLQSVGDSLSGAAAQAGVDLVLYHGDIDMKHVAVKGDECGVSYALSHVSTTLPSCRDVLQSDFLHRLFVK